RLQGDWSSDVCSSDLFTEHLVALQRRKVELWASFRREAIVLHICYDAHDGPPGTLGAAPAHLLTNRIRTRKQLPGEDLIQDDRRSEERRVGKECRCKR